MATSRQSPKRPREQDRLHFLRALDTNPSQLDAALKACERLTDEQLEAIKQARTPQAIKSDADRGGNITILLAAAASGKTTTMLALVEALCAYGHGTKGGEFTLYAMFNKNAADDGKSKIGGLSRQAVKSVDCRTSHSAVLQHHAALKQNVSFGKRSSHHEWHCEQLSDEKIEKYVLRVCSAEIHEHVTSGNSPPGSPHKLQRDQELCAFWVYKTWLGWVHKACGEDALLPSNVDARTRVGRLTYFPCVKNWTEATSGGGKRRPRLAGCFPGTFYTACALKLWRRMMEERLFVTHDAYLKYAQLSNHRFDWFDTMLLDESQDLTECQVGRVTAA